MVMEMRGGRIGDGDRGEGEKSVSHTRPKSSTGGNLARAPNLISPDQDQDFELTECFIS
jgi:hypothetical protein